MTTSGRWEVEVGGHRLEVVGLNDAGDDPTLVFLHEGLGSIELWRSFPGDLTAATGHRGLVYSRLGHGWSDVLSGPRPLDFFEREALDVLPPLLESLNITRPILVGHSDGASIALIHAVYHDVAALVLLAPHVFVEDFGLLEIARLTSEWSNGTLEKKMARYHRDPAATFFGWSDVWLDPAFREWTMVDLLPRIRCPVLTIQGLTDPYGTLTHVSAIEDAVKTRVQRTDLEDCDHHPHLSQPGATLETAARFIESVATSSGV